MNELEARIRGSLQTRAQDVEPSPALWRQVQAHRSRLRRRVWFGAIAVAAAAVSAAVAVPLVVAGLRHQPPDVLIDPTPTETASGQPSSPSQDSATPDDKPPATNGAPDEERLSLAGAVLRSWLQAIQDGDEDRAWDLMTPEAQAAVGRDRFDEMMASELPEGLGSFADASNFHYVVVSSESDDTRVAAVVSSTVTREGTTEFAAMAIPMRSRAGENLVDDPIIDRSRYYDRVAAFASTSIGPQPYHAGDELIVEFARPHEATAVYVAVDDDKRPCRPGSTASAGKQRPRPSAASRQAATSPRSSYSIDPAGSTPRRSSSKRLRPSASAPQSLYWCLTAPIVRSVRWYLSHPSSLRPATGPRVLTH